MMSCSRCSSSTIWLDSCCCRGVSWPPEDPGVASSWAWRLALIFSILRIAPSAACDARSAATFSSAMPTAFASDAAGIGPRGDDRNARHVGRGLHLQPFPQLVNRLPTAD
jgi:hypothetical protein